MDFYKIKQKSTKKDQIEIYPDFVVCRSKDVMFRGKTFYAVWDESLGLWNTDEYAIQRIVDDELHGYLKGKEWEGHVVLRTMADYSTNSWDSWKRYLKNSPDNYHQLDLKVTFANTEVQKNDYISRRLPYSMEMGSTEAYDEIMSTLYDPDERAKLEWAIGAIISGDAKKIQKFIVLYGEQGAGKSTVLNIIQKLFEGYTSTFNAKELTDASSAFATDAFSNDPLVAIQHDGDLSTIKDNSLLNSIVSHEEIIVNEKFKARYSTKANCFMFMATNKPVKITDAKSGIIRRLIDVKPSGRKLSENRYNKLYSNVDFELGAIAYHCLEVYKSMGKNYYASYKPVEMMFKTDPFFNYVEAQYDIFKEQDGVSLKAAYTLYKDYCDEAEESYKMQMYKFREELKNYFSNFEEYVRLDNGQMVRSYYSGFLSNKFRNTMTPTPKEKKEETGMIFNSTESLFDIMAADWKAQYAKEDESPKKSWDSVGTKLKSLDTTKLHYVMVPDNHIVIDFDLKDENGKKSFKLNSEAAAKWPKTYGELSKGGQGIHLHYIYDGDVTKLARVYDKDIEIKVFTGKSSLRRRLSKCNDIPVAKLTSGLPLAETKGDKMVNFENVKDEQHLKAIIVKCLKKDTKQPYTTPCISLIKETLDQAYNSGMKYDLSDLYPDVRAFANNSTHQAQKCLQMVSQMKFKSEEDAEPMVDGYSDDRIVFYDVEVFPNLFLINWKYIGEENPVVRMINPTPLEVEAFLKHKLVGFNNMRYDNHICYARMLGYTNEQLFDVSQKIINNSRSAMFANAYNASYTDIYDYSSKKQSLKKWEIELGIHHQELGLPWDQPVPEERWEEVAEYCDNDVIATEAVWNATQPDFLARQILADIAGLTVNDSTNKLTTKIIFGNERKPQLVYTHLDTGIQDFGPGVSKPYEGELINSFPGYSYTGNKNMYKGEDVGKGGYVYSNPGMYERTITFDVASMHPHSILAMNCFGQYTKNFKELIDIRIAIKHKDYDKARSLMDGKLAKYLTDDKTAKQLSNALKIPINSVYGLTSASFDNAFKDTRNVNNIVALRGALFMMNLKEEVLKRGYTVVHIKTDSIKIANPDKDICDFVMEFGKKYGYTFEVEHIFEKICLVNDAVYIAKLAEDDPEAPGEWTATGTQFAVPYVFKTLFSKEPIEFRDLCETKTVSGGALYLDMNENLPDVSMYESELEYRTKKGKPFHNVILQATTDEELENLIKKGHDYRFIGKAGSYCPIKPGCGGGILYREKDGKYFAATGTSGYRWLEAETVEVNGREGDIDISYYDDLCKKAIETIEKYGKFDYFVGEVVELPWNN